MKFLLLLSTVFFISLSSNAQQWLSDIQRQDVNFFAVQKEFNDWKSANPGLANDSGEYENITEQYYRWERYWMLHINPDGTLKNPNEVIAERKKYLNQLNASPRLRGNTGNWTQLGYASAGNPGFIGRIDCIATSLVDSNVLWAGAPTGGLWKSTNRGASWTTTTDTLADLGISDIVIDPLKPNTIFIATGNRDDASEGGGTFSIGVLKSNDGGNTWLTTGLSWGQNIGYGNIIKRLLIDPTNDSILYAAVVSFVTSSIMKSTDGGNTWNVIYTAQSANAELDIALQPGNPKRLYVGFADRDDGKVQVSTSDDGGITHVTDTLISSGAALNIHLAVTPANPNYVYVLVANTQDFNSFYLSGDAGTTFNLQSTSPNILGHGCSNPGAGDGQGFYDISLAASPINANEVFVGGISIWKSYDAGVDWTISACWGDVGMHADQHYTLFSPYHPNIIYEGNDGGIFESRDTGNTWNPITNNIITTQYYGGDVSQINPDYVIGGCQDNGTLLTGNNALTELAGGDGSANTFFNFANNNTYFFTIGFPYADVNGANSYQCPIGNFTNNPSNPNCYMAYADGVLKSFDFGQTFTKQLPNEKPVNYDATDVKFPADDSDVMFGIMNFQLYKMDAKNGATVNMADTVPQLGVDTHWNVDYCVSNTDTNKVWLIVEMQTYHVFYTANGGLLWTDITGSLPGVTFNNIIYQSSSNDAVYVATDMGVFYRDASMSDWQYWSNGLPNTIISRLKIDYTTSEIYAITFGRGIWKADLNSVSGIKLVSAHNAQIKIYPNPNNGNFTFQMQNVNQDARLEIFNMLGEEIRDINLKSNTTQLNLSDRPAGIYFSRIINAESNLIAEQKFIIQ